MDFSNSVIMPREDFVELQEAAWNQPPQSAKERIASMAQVTLFFASASVAATAVSWAWFKANDWFEEQQLRRQKELNNQHFPK